MRRLPWIWIILLLAATAPGPVRAEQRVDRLIAYILDALEAAQTRCEERQFAGHDGKRVVCGVFADSFSAFKSDWDIVMRHSRIPIEIETEDTWTFRRGAYEITYLFDGPRELIVRFEPEARGVVFAYEEDEVDPYAAQARSGPLDLPGKEAPPRMAGFGGVSVPKLIEESRVEPLRSFRAQAERVAGRATLEIVVGRDGKVRDIVVLKEEPTGYDFGKSADEAVRQWRFEPATFEGRPVAAVMNRTVEVQRDPPPPGDD